MVNDTKNSQEVIAMIKEAQTGSKIIDLAKEKSLCEFQMAHLPESLKVLRENRFSDHITVNYHLITLFSGRKNYYGVLWQYSALL